METAYSQYFSAPEGITIGRLGKRNYNRVALNDINHSQEFANLNENEGRIYAKEFFYNLLHELRSDPDFMEELKKHFMKRAVEKIQTNNAQTNQNKISNK